MSRLIIKKDTATHICNLRGARGKGITMRVISAGTIFYTPDRNVLEFADITGTPSAGMPLSNTDPIQTYYWWGDDLWARASIVDLEIEFFTFKNGAA